MLRGTRKFRTNSTKLTRKIVTRASATIAFSIGLFQFNPLLELVANIFADIIQSLYNATLIQGCELFKVLNPEKV